MDIRARTCARLCIRILHSTTLPECSFNDTSEKFNKRAEESFRGAGGRRNWKTNLGRIPLSAASSLSLISSRPRREVSEKFRDTPSRLEGGSAETCALRLHVAILTTDPATDRTLAKIYRDESKSMSGRDHRELVLLSSPRVRAILNNLRKIQTRPYARAVLRRGALFIEVMRHCRGTPLTSSRSACTQGALFKSGLRN